MKQNQSCNSIQPDDASRFGNAKLKFTGIVIAVALACCSALTLASKALSEPEPALTKTGSALAPAPPVAQSANRRPAWHVKFNLFDVGIYPREVHVSKGLVAISIEDYSGGTSGLVVGRETGNAPDRVGSVERGGKGWRAQNEFQLGPGRYIVHMTDRPDNRALLVVEN